MEKNNITLSNINLSQYHITKSGQVYHTATATEIQQGSRHRFWLTDDSGKKRKITQKVLYKAAYNKEYCVDNIQDYPKEEWKEIQNTDGKYFVSNCGRVKSLCGYHAIILQPYLQQSGYYIVKINGINAKIHRLVAFAFCENEYKECGKVEIHHKDGNRTNNHASNLCILSVAEHKKIHGKKEDVAE